MLLTVPAALPGQTGTVAVNGVSLPYVVEGTGPPLVLIHGWAVNHRYWDGNVGELARHATVIRYDRRGFGAAGGKPDPTADAADLKALLDQLGYARVYVMGHSAGASAALTFAVRYPAMVEGLVLFGPGPTSVAGLPPPAAEHAPPVQEWIAAGRTHGVDSLRAAIARWAARSFGGTPTPAAMERARRMLQTYSGADLLDPAPPSNLVEPVRVDELATVRVPTLILVGEQEMVMVRQVADVLADRIPGARLVVIPGGGHTVNWLEPERFAAEVRRFLRVSAQDRSAGPVRH